MSDNRGYTLAEQIMCVRRELAIRKSVYPQWVKSKRMKAEAADHEIACMQAVHDTLQRDQRLFDVIAHGSEEHRAWLRKAIDDHFAGRPVEPPR
jgi:hypothetical protein